MKLESTLPAGLRDQLRAACDAIEILPVPTNPLLGHESTYERLLEAASRRQCVRIHYESLTEWKEICTRLNPYRLLFSRRSWYVIGRSSLHRSTRTFNVGRIRKLEVLDDHFEIPQGFSIDRYLRNAWHLISGPDADVVIRFSKMVAQNVAEVAWHKTQQTTFNDDGTLDFRVKVSGLEEISWWILGYGDQAEVLSPVKLRRMIADRVVHMADIYRDESLPR